jgi:hypothetical protein
MIQLLLLGVAACVVVGLPVAARLWRRWMDRPDTAWYTGGYTYRYTGHDPDLRVRTEQKRVRADSAARAAASIVSTPTDELGRRRGVGLREVGKKEVAS